MENADDYKYQNSLSVVSTIPAKEPEPERRVGIWFDGKQRLRGSEITMLCIFYGLIGNPEVETAFTSDDIIKAKLLMDWECPPSFDLIQVRTDEGEVVCELDDCINRFKAIKDEENT